MYIGTAVYTFYIEIKSLPKCYVITGMHTVIEPNKVEIKIIKLYVFYLLYIFLLLMK